MCSSAADPIHILRALLPAGKLEATERYESDRITEPDDGMDVTVWQGVADAMRDELAAGWAEALTVRQCGAENPHKMIPSRCPFCGEDLIPACCLDLAQDCYRDGKKQSESDLAAVTAERDRWEWVARNRRALRVSTEGEFSWGWACVPRDEDGPGGSEVEWLLARYDAAQKEAEDD